MNCLFQIKVLDKSEGEWWRGRLVDGGAEGIFPATYVQDGGAPW